MPNGTATKIKELQDILDKLKTRKRKEPEESEQPDLTPLQKRLQEGKDLFILPEEAKELGYTDIPEGWMLKVTPPKNGEAPLFNFLSPEGKTLSPDQIVSYDTGWEEVSGQVWDYGKQEFRPASDREITEREQWPAEIAPGRMSPEEYLLKQDQLQQERTDLLKNIYPTFFENQPDTALTDISNTVANLIVENPDAQMNFFEQIQKRGRTAETEKLLQMFIPQITPFDIAEFFSKPAEGDEFVTPEKIKSYLAGEQELPTNPEIEEKKSLWNTFYGSLRQSIFNTDIAVNKLLSMLPESPLPFAQERSKEERLRFKQNYTRSRIELNDWLEKHPEIEPPVEIQKFKEEAGQLPFFEQLGAYLKNPKAMAYTIAEGAPPTLAALVAFTATTALTGNPILGGVASFATFAPMQIEDVAQDLISAGADEDQAYELALPVGMLISSLDVVGEIPLLKALSPALKGLTKGLQKELVDRTMVALFKKGLVTFTTQEFTEALTEVSQQVIQDYTVSFFDKTRDPFGNVSQTAVQTLIQVAPFALFGGAVTIVNGKRTNLSDLYEQKTSEYEKTGYPTQEAKIQALNDMAKLPEAETAIKNTYNGIAEKEGVAPEQPAVVPTTPPETGVTPAEVPKAEVGMPESGLQPAMIPEVAAKEVRPKGKGKIIQISMEDQLKLEQARREAATPEGIPEAEREAYQVGSEIEGLKEWLASERATKLVNLIKKSGWYKGEVKNLTLKQYRDLTGKQYILPNILTPDKKHVRWEYAFDEVATELGYPNDEALKEAIEKTGEVMRRIKELRSEMTTITKPPSSLPEPSSEETAITGNKELTPRQIERTLELFGDYVEGKTAQSAWELTQELRKETRAQRAENLKNRTQQLIIEGQPTEDAMNQAITETLAGELPTLTTDYLSDLTDRMRDTLFARVYEVLKDEPFEMASTKTALTNALLGKPIPRELGTKGGSAYTRLQRVFGTQPKMLKAITTMASEQKSLEDVVEGVFHEIGRPPIPVDEKTAEYLRKLKSDVLYKPSFGKEPIPVTQYEFPIEDGVKQMPLMPRPITDNIVRALKEIGMLPVDIGNFLRANKASVDFSFWRQQAPLIASHPVTFLQANVEAWKAMWSQKSAEASWQRITRDPLYQIYEFAEAKGGDFLRPLELKKGTDQWRGVEEFGYLTGERTLPKLTMKLPWVKISARAFETGANVHNWLIFKNYYKAMNKLSEQYASGKKKLKVGEVFDINKEMVDFSKSLANFTARGSLGKFAVTAPELSGLFFAPRASIGRILSVKDLINSNPRVRKEAWKNAATFVGTFGGLVLLGAQMGWWSVEKDPRSAEYMSIRLGNTRIDPWGGYRQFLVFFTRAITQTGVSSVTGAEYKADPLDLIQNLIRGKASPLASLILDFWRGKNFVGEEVDVKNKKQWVERIAPFAVWDIYEAYQDDPEIGIAISIPAFVGAGVQTYTGDWKENVNKLGLPKYSDNLVYGLNEPVYDVRDFWADTASQFKGVDPETLTVSKGYPKYIQAMAEADRFDDEMKMLPNQSLVSLNTDQSKGTTFDQYYRMWQDREKIVESGDKEKLKEFDADDRTRNAYLGNMSQRDYANLVQYHSIADKKKQAEFLKKHPELETNPREEYLKSHPEDNAKLAIWGQAKLLTQAAYDKAQQLINEFDIPDSAVAEYIPPKEIAKAYFERNDIVSQFGANSWEDKLIRASNPELNKWIGLEKVETPIASLELRVEHREQFDLLGSYSDEDSPKYIANKEKRKVAIKELRLKKLGGVEFRDIERRVDAIEKGTNDAPTPDEIVDSHIEYMKMQDEEGVGSATAEVMLYRVDNPDYNEWRMNKNIWEDQALKPIEEDKIPIWSIDAKYRKEDGEYDAIPEDDRDARLKYLTDHPEYRMDRRRREAYREEFLANQVETFVNYHELSVKGMRQERLLVADAGFAEAMHKLKGIDIPKPEDVPAVGFDEAYERWPDQFTEYEGLADIKSEHYVEDEDERKKTREKLFADNPEFARDFRRWEAYGAKGPKGERFTEDEVNLFADYYTLDAKGMRRERLLLENSEFAKSMHNIQNLDIPKKVPSVQYDDIYDKYQKQFETLGGYSDNKSPYYIEDVDARKEAYYNLRFTNDKLNEFGKAEVRREGYGLYIPEEYINRYVGWRTVQKEGVPKDHPTDKQGNKLTYYGDDWYLLEHPAFYENVYVKLMEYTSKQKEEKDKQLDKVPSREVFPKYAQFVLLPEGKARLDFRWNNRDLDSWLLKTKKVSTSIAEQRRRAAMTPRERMSEELQKWIDELEKIGR